MPPIKLEFGKGSWPALDESTVDGPLSPSLIDGFQDEQGVFFMRPGFSYPTNGYTQLPTVPGQGLFWSLSLQCFIAVSGGVIYKVTRAGVYTECAGATVPANAPARFAETSTLVYVTAGGKLVTTDGSTSSLVSDVLVASLNSTHVAWIDGHIIMNESGTGRFYWTETNSTTWDSYATADGDLDHIVALGAGWRELILCGTRSTEIWYNDGGTPSTFRRLEGAFIERGCSAPYSLIKADNTWFWLDHERCFVRLEGRNPKVVSAPIARLLRELSDVSDLTCSHFQFLNRRFILLYSSASDFSYVYDYQLDCWYSWGVWIKAQATYNAWQVISIGFSPEYHEYLVMTRAGQIYCLGDTGASGTLAVSYIPRFLLRSSHMSFGVYKWKIASELLVRIKRGYAPYNTSYDPDQFWVRWRDQNKGWQNERLLSLGAMGDYDNVEHIHRLGRFRTRQFEFVCSVPHPFAFVGAELSFEVVDD